MVGFLLFYQGATASSRCWCYPENAGATGAVCFDLDLKPHVQISGRALCFTTITELRSLPPRAVAQPAVHEADALQQAKCGGSGGRTGEPSGCAISHPRPKA